jgi:anti-sigma regulatory factor (Ser/Thr protein kinase)
VKRETADAVWPSATPPPVAVSAPGSALTWELHELTALPGVRADLRRYARRNGSASDVRDQLILALDEMASNALRHGGTPVVASVHETEGAYLIDVADAAPGAPPRPAVDRDPSEGGLGLYLVAQLAAAHGWYVRGGAKHVWALLPRQ